MKGRDCGEVRGGGLLSDAEMHDERTMMKPSLMARIKGRGSCRGRLTFRRRGSEVVTRMVGGEVGRREKWTAAFEA